MAETRDGRGYEVWAVGTATSCKHTSPTSSCVGANSPPDVGCSLLTYNCARRLKTLHGLTPYEYICKIWTSEPDRFILNPIHQMPGLNI